MLTTLRRIVIEFTQDNELEQALYRMVSQVKAAMGTDCCSIYLADHREQHFVLMASDGLAINSLGQTTINFTEGLVGLVGQREEPLNIANAQEHPHFIHAPEVQEDDLNAFLGTPIIHQRKVLGVISIQQKEARNFTENEEAFLVTLATQIAATLASIDSIGGLIESDHQKGPWSRPLKGIAGAQGLAVAPLHFVQLKADLSAIAVMKVADVDAEYDRLDLAIQRTSDNFEELAEHMRHFVSDNSLDIFEMYKQMLSNAHLGKEVKEKIALGWSAESALKLTIDHYVLQFESIEESYFRERASDIRDLGNRILFHLQSRNESIDEVPERFILVADDVTASLVAEYQHKGLAGIVSLTGSNNSHAAILARSLGVPAVMGLEFIPLIKLHNQLAIIDGYSGEIIIQPSDALIAEYRHLIDEETRLADKVNQVINLPAITKDGKSIELLLNAGLTNGFEHSKQVGAVGIGLYRTEIPFMDRSCFPSEYEQTQLYSDVLTAFPQQMVTMRTLDVGGDKSLPYFPIVEENPFLGWRGIRITLDHPEVFLVQIRAMLRASAGHNNLEIMLPMISNVTEVDEAQRLINQAFYEVSSELEEQGVKLVRPRIGIMIEVPSVLFILKELATRVDFFSVGSNDLTQYLLAVDRNNTRVANLYSAYHPSVLRALNYIAEQAHHLLIPLSICGELASEPAGALLLLAMGYDKLSMNPHNIAKIKWVVRHIEHMRAKAILSHVLKFSDEKQVHNYLNEQLEKLGLGGFIRAGM
ncbi:phosphoenolpyruvate--protein phosphotransferase [Thalassotalea fusca]